jgi:hypothetical protein
MEDAPFLGGLQPGQGGGVPLWNGAAPGPGNPTIETNNDWNRHALTILIGMSYDPTMAAGALTKFLQGKPLNDAENAVVQRALQLAGPPPIPPPAPTLTAPTTPAPPPAAPPGVPPPAPSSDPLGTPNLKGPGQGYALGNRGTYITRPGDNLQRVAEFIYGFGPTQVGAAEQFRWRQIYDANTAGALAGFPADGSYPLPVGATLWLPL